MDNKNVNISFSGWFVGVLTLIFITLKLLGKISWSWIWVLSPLWISGLIGLTLIVIFIWFMKR